MKSDKKPKKKLTLSKETLRHLSSDQLRSVLGGNETAGCQSVDTGGQVTTSGMKICSNVSDVTL